MTTALAYAGRRVGLDALVAQMLEPGFVARFARTPSAPFSSGHVNPAFLALESPKSPFVRRWRRHARRCPRCRSVFRCLGLKLS